MARKRKWTNENIDGCLAEIAKTHKEISKNELCELCKKAAICHPDIIIYRFGSIRKKLELFGIKYPKSESQMTRQLMKENVCEKQIEQFGEVKADEITKVMIEEINKTEIPDDTVEQTIVEEINKTEIPDDTIEQTKAEITNNV